MIGKLRDKIKGNKETKAKDVTLKQDNVARDRIEQTTDADTPGEAAAHDTTQKITGQSVADKRKILVVSPSDHCSDPVVDYAVGFAERMGYDIIVVNVLPLETHSPKLQPYCSVIHEEFKDGCRKNIVGFQKACAEKGIGFLHLVRSGDVNRCIREIHEEYGRIEFVVSDPVASPDVTKDGEEPVIPVFSLAY